MASTSPDEVSGPASLPLRYPSTEIAKHPRRVPTDSSFYDFHGTRYSAKIPDAQTWIYAREARQQQATVDPNLVRNGKDKIKYPSLFNNYDNKLSLSTPGSLEPNGRTAWVHQPLIPGQVTAWNGECAPGAVRSFYTRGNSGHFDVGYHPLNDRSGFSMATYHPASGLQQKSQEEWQRLDRQRQEQQARWERWDRRQQQ
ncbi:hypothetical protein OQA88_10962 [Cercophora sp. LCS_1]